MTWQLAALVVLAVALAAGFYWYERTRPDARIVALVGTLAGFGALGRIAFAAVPNVKPTTDIVLVAGYALGGGPGFAVGALAGLTSNFFFGQGPWTPWQMAAWGATGVLGAGLALVSGRRIGRITLAAVCGACGFAFTVVQDIGDWVTYSDHSLTQLGLYVGRGLGFDAIHAAGCVAFALAFGPALIRSLQRFARRLNVTWLPTETSSGGVGLPLIALLAVFAAGVLVHSPATARAVPVPALERAAAYLRAAQNSDGGFGADRGQPSAALFTGWAALGLAATERSPLTPAASGASAVDYVRSHLSGRRPRCAGAHDSRPSGRRPVPAQLRRPRSRRRAARRAAGPTVQRPGRSTSPRSPCSRCAAPAPRRLPRTTAWLRHAQNHDGGFGFASGVSSDADDTGAVLEALAGVTGAGQARARAVAYLRHAQNRDGGFAAASGAGSNAQSTAWAVQGLIAAGVSPASLHHGGPSPIGYLSSLVGPGRSGRLRTRPDPDTGLGDRRGADGVGRTAAAAVPGARFSRPPGRGSGPRGAEDGPGSAAPNRPSPDRPGTATTAQGARYRPAAARHQPRHRCCGGRDGDRRRVRTATARRSELDLSALLSVAKALEKRVKRGGTAMFPAFRGRSR